MVWTPQFSIIKARAVVPNLLTYFQAHQADALLWAYGSALKPFQQFSDTVANRSAPVFPSIAFKRDSSRTTYGNDTQLTEYSVVFEMVIENQAPNLATSQARAYRDAVISMITNCPDATLGANTGCLKPMITEVADNFDEIQANAPKNDFFQEIEIGTTISLQTGIFS